MEATSSAIGLVAIMALYVTIGLGVYRGWLGVIFYFWVLHRDPWLEVLGS